MTDVAVARTMSGDRVGAVASFPYDRATVERFKQTFPRARWVEDDKSWFVPGVTAARRLDRWLAREMQAISDLEDARGRDAFAFEPIASPYLEIADDLRIRAPYSRTIVEELRAVPWSSWDDELRAWRVPFRSYEDLRHRWPAIEAAARRNEPEERKKRREQEKDSEERRNALRLAAERQRHRYPVAAIALPPLQRPVMTERYGAVVFEEVTGEVVERSGPIDIYTHADRPGVDYVWAAWRTPTLEELISAWPSRRDPDEAERARGWWQPGREDLQAARRRLRALERARNTRQRRLASA